jgi:hypothetical protein
VEVVLENTGRAEVVDVRSSSNVLLAAALPTGEMPKIAVSNPSVSVIAPGFKTVGDPLYEGGPLTDLVMKQIDSGQLKFYCFGMVTYKSFGVEHTTEFCFQPNPKGKDAIVCGKWNTAR